MQIIWFYCSMFNLKVIGHETHSQLQKWRREPGLPRSFTFSKFIRFHYFQFIQIVPLMVLTEIPLHSVYEGQLVFHLMEIWISSLTHRKIQRKMVLRYFLESGILREFNHSHQNQNLIFMIFSILIFLLSLCFFNHFHYVHCVILYVHNFRYIILYFIQHNWNLDDIYSYFVLKKLCHISSLINITFIIALTFYLRLISSFHLIMKWYFHFEDDVIIFGHFVSLDQSRLAIFVIFVWIPLPNPDLPTHFSDPSSRLPLFFLLKIPPSFTPLTAFSFIPLELLQNSS